jgi:hypothetical protein
MALGWFKVQQAVEKGSECFESLSINGKTPTRSMPSVRPEPVEGLPESFSTACQDSMFDVG